MPATMPTALADRSNADTNLSVRRSVDRRANGASQAHLVTPRRRYAADTAVIAGRTPQPHRNGCKEYPYNRPANTRHGVILHGKPLSTALSGPLWRRGNILRNSKRSVRGRQAAVAAPTPSPRAAEGKSVLHSMSL